MTLLILEIFYDNLKISITNLVNILNNIRLVIRKYKFSKIILKTLYL